MSRIAVVGAGMAGLAAARALQAQGLAVTVFEKSRGFGGRCATRWIGDYRFDTGATFVTPDGHALGAVIQTELSTDGLIQIEKPMFACSKGRVMSGEVQHPTPRRFCYQSGMNELGKRLAEGLDVQRETRIESLARRDLGFEVNGALFDGVIVAIPLPQAQDLLAEVYPGRGWPSVRYRKCLSVLLGFDHRVEVPYHGLVDPQQDEPIAWISFEHEKVPSGRAPEGHMSLVVQLNERTSDLKYDREASAVVQDVMVDLRRMFPTLKDPVASDVMRWRYSHAIGTVGLQALNRGEDRLILTGDMISGARAQLAYDAGLAAAGELTARLG